MINATKVGNMPKNMRMTLARDIITAPTRVRGTQIRASEAFLSPVSEEFAVSVVSGSCAIFDTASRHQDFIRNNIVTTIMVSTTDDMAAVCWPINSADSACDESLFSILSISISSSAN